MARKTKEKPATAVDGPKEKYIVIDVNNGTVEFFDDRRGAKEYMEDQINDDDVDEGDVRLFRGREVKFDTERKSTVLIVDE